MKYAKIEDDEFVKFVQLREEYSNISFPLEIKKEDLPHGIVEVQEAKKPDISQNQYLSLMQAPTLIDGVWVIDFEVQELQETQEEKLRIAISEARIYLQSTDYKMTVDYFATLMLEEQITLSAARAKAREFIRMNDV